MSQRNKNNSIIFLTTLSVYLGLVLVGGTSSVLAQQAEIVSQHWKISESRFANDACSETSIAEILGIIAKYDVAQLPYSFVYQINYTENKSPSLEVLLAEGNESSIESLRRFVTCNVDLLKQLKDEKSVDTSAKEFSEAILVALFPYNSVLQDIKATKKEIVSKVTYSFSVNEQAKKYFAQLDQSAISRVKKVGTPALTAESELENVIVDNSTYHFENNQVFIVTRLPRGSLDALFKQDAKAANE